MIFFNEIKLSRVEITKPCCVFAPIQPLIPTAIRSAMCTLSPGIRGWLVKKYGKAYFKPDRNQENMHYVSNIKHTIIIPFKKIEGCYMRIESCEITVQNSTPIIHKL